MNFHWDEKEEFLEVACDLHLKTRISMNSAANGILGRENNLCKVK